MVDPRRPDERSAPHHAIVICMAMALFLFLLWLGMTIIGDNATNSAAIAFVLTIIFVFSLYWQRRPKRPH
jgi:Flp pilus assembly protein TadB